MKIIFVISFILYFGNARADEVVSSFDAEIAALAAQDSNCTPLKPGDSLAVNDDAADSPTSLPRRYKLTRDKKNPKAYNVELPYAFSSKLAAALEVKGNSAKVLSPNDRDRNSYMSANTAAEDIATAEVAQSMLAKVQACFQQMRGKFTGPDGTQINFSIAKREDRGGYPLQVKVEPENARSNSVAWSRTAACSTIIHESLHWTGLVDGYPESDRSLGYECRNREPEASIMSRSETALNERFQFRFCNPVPGTKAQVIHALSFKEAKCPGATNSKTQFMSPEAKDFTKEEIEYSLKNLGDLPGSVIYVGPTAPAKPLYPAHVRMITLPNCKVLNRRYVTCSHDAYKSTGQCPTPKAYCQNGEQLK